MDLSGIISISGKPGLYKVIAHAKNGLVVESLLDGKRMNAHVTHRISALEDISIYTYDDDVPLGDVYQSIFEKEDGGAAINHKASANELKEYLTEVLPNFDEDRVYHSDLKKLFQWYNLLQSNDLLKQKEESDEEPAEESEAQTPVATTADVSADEEKDAEEA